MVNKKLFLVVPVLLIVAGIGAYLLLRPKEKIVSPISSLPSTSPISQVQVKTKVWEDPAGFRFEYPENLTVNNHPENKNDYAQVELSAAGQSGGLTVWMKDLPRGGVEGWASGYKDGQVIDSQLGGRGAKKVVKTDSGKMMIAAEDNEVIVIIDMTPGDDSYWGDVFKKVSDSFEFVSVSEGPASAQAQETVSQTSDSGVVEEEEVVE